MLLGGPSTEIGCNKLEPEVTKVRRGSGTGDGLGAGAAGTIAGASLGAGAGTVAGAGAGAIAGTCAWTVDSDGHRSTSQPFWPAA